MRLSTSTNICAFTATRARLPVEFSMDACAKAGYRVLDINWCMAMNPDSPLRGDGWEGYVDRIGESAARHGIVFSQAHLPYYDMFSPDGTEDTATLMEMLVRRSILASGRLRVPWAVTHPGTEGTSGRDVDSSLRRNIQYFAPHVELAQKAGVGIALENDFEDGARRYVFCAAVNELSALVDAFDDPAVGACYDFGHANLGGGAHRRNLQVLGARVKTLHVHDNHGASDEHLMPFYGSIDWRDAMAGLKDIGYRGDLTYEIQEFGRYLPADLKHLVVEQSLVIGQRLLDMAEGAQERA